MSNLNLKKLRQAQQVVNSDPDFRSLGNIDIKLGLKVCKSIFTSNMFSNILRSFLLAGSCIVLL